MAGGAKKPWFKFYPQDWRSDEKLRLCSLAARGLWVECMCIMHRAERYGHLEIQGTPLTEAQLAAQVGASADEVAHLIGELEQAGVFSRNRKGVIYSRRMTEDHKKANAARKNGQNGGNPALTANPLSQTKNKASDKDAVKGTKKDIAHARPRGQRPETPYSPPTGDDSEDSFDRFWQAYPRKVAKGQARKAWTAALKKTDAERIIAAVQAYADRCKQAETEMRFIAHPATWLNGERWDDEDAAPANDKAENAGPDWRSRLSEYQQYGVWPMRYGPRPEQAGCHAPAELLAEHGYRRAA